MVARMTITMFLFVVLVSVQQTTSAFTPGACRQDAEKFCPGIGDKQITPCLKDHMEELSTPCKVNLAEAREMVRTLQDACATDIEKFCPDMQRGQGRIRRCLRQHESELTTTCKTEITAARKKLGTPAPGSEPVAVSTGTK